VTVDGIPPAPVDALEVLLLEGKELQLADLEDGVALDAGEDNDPEVNE